MKFQTYQARTAKASWGWRLVEENGRIIADTGGYDSYGGVNRAVKELQGKASELASATVEFYEPPSREHQLVPATIRKRRTAAVSLLDAVAALSRKSTAPKRRRPSQV